MLPTLSGVKKRYRLQQKLGAGGMGEVYAAQDRLTGTRVALKRVMVAPQELLFSTHPTYGDQIDLRRVLANEFKVLSSLRHPHIISVLDYDFDIEHYPFYTMTLLENPRTIIEAARNFTYDERINAFAQMLQALAYLHRRGILHRDLKPGNVLVDERNAVKLLDFGLATQESVSGTSGTLAYMPPEIIQQGLATPQSDLYSIGIVSYELFAGQYPFAVEKMTSLLKLLLKQMPDMEPVPPELRPILYRLMMKNPAARYPDAESVLADLAGLTKGSITVEDSTQRESFLQAARFVGRERELNLLTDQLDQIVRVATTISERSIDTDCGAAYLIGGESGVGKSRLLDELRTHALLNGALLLRGQCVAESGQPFQMWRDVVRRLLLEHEISDLEAGILREIIPDIADLLQRDIPLVPVLGALSTQSRLIETIIGLFQRQTQPVLLVLEDLQWGRESLIPLRHLLAISPQLPLLIVGSFRNDEAPKLPQDLPEMRTLFLGRFTPHEIAELSQAMIGAAGEQKMVIDYLSEKSEGNIFFLVEVIRALAEDAGNLSSIGSKTLPEQIVAGGIERIIARRLERLPAEAVPTLQLAAVAGRNIDENLLRWLVGDEADRWLQAGMDAAILDVMDAQWRFSHDRLRDAVVCLIPQEDLPRYHRHIAEGLEALYPDKADLAMTLYEHWQIAGNAAKEAYYAVMALEQNMLIGMQHKASQMLEKALSLKPQDARLQLKLSYLAGEIYIELRQPQLSRDAYTEALRLAQQLNQPQIAGIALEGLGNTAQALSDFDAALRWYAQSLKLRREIGDVRGIASALHATSIAHRMRGNYDLSGTALEESLALRRQINEPRGLSDTLYQMSVRMRNEGNYEEAISYLRESVDLYQRTGDTRGLGGALINLGICHTLTGDYEQARQNLTESLAIRKAMDDPRGEASCQNAIGELHLAKEQYGAAIRAFGISLRIWQEAADLWNTANCYISMGYTQAMARETFSAKHHLHEGLEIAYRIPAWFLIVKALIGWAQMKLCEGDDFQAARLLGAADNHPAMTAQLRQIYFNPVVLALDIDTHAPAYMTGKETPLDILITQILAESRQRFQAETS